MVSVSERFPVVGEVVHYVSVGSPVREDGSQLYPSVCRAALVTETYDFSSELGLMVVNPTGQFFNRRTPNGNAPGEESGVVFTEGVRDLCGSGRYAFPPGSWHYPHRFRGGGPDA